MKYPYRRYLYFLLSKGYRPGDIQALCAADGLLPPNEPALGELARELGVPPVSPRIGIRHAGFARWAGALKIYTLWADDVDALKAKDLLHRPNVRETIQTLWMVHWDADVVLQELKVNYPPHLVPSMGTLKAFLNYFWDFDHMNAQEIYEYLEMIDQDQNGALVPAIDGDLAMAYARRGLKQRVEAVDFYDKLISYSYQQLDLHMRDGTKTSGNAMIGIASLARAAGDAIEAKKELTDTQKGTGTSIIDQVREFKLKRKERKRIISMDELTAQEEGEVIDVEYEEAENVHRLKPR